MQEALYIEADGSMLLTLEESWKKVKLGRIFKASDCIHADEKAGWISNSQYVAHFGGHKKFTLQMELKNLADSIFSNMNVDASTKCALRKKWQDAITELQQSLSQNLFPGFVKDSILAKGSTWTVKLKDKALEIPVRLQALKYN